MYGSVRVPWCTGQATGYKLLHTHYTYSHTLATHSPHIFLYTYHHTHSHTLTTHVPIHSPHTFPYTHHTCSHTLTTQFPIHSPHNFPYTHHTHSHTLTTNAPRIRKSTTMTLTTGVRSCAKGRTLLTLALEKLSSSIWSWVVRLCLRSSILTLYTLSTMFLCV